MGLAAGEGRGSETEPEVDSRRHAQLSCVRSVRPSVQGWGTVLTKLTKDGGTLVVYEGKTSAYMKINMKFNVRSNTSNHGKEITPKDSRVRV